MKRRDCPFAEGKKQEMENRAPQKQKIIFKALKLGFNEEVAMAEAKRCLSNFTCSYCEVCILLCPDLCITRNELTEEIEIDLNYCKGCGICACVCPKGAIKMIFEET